MESVIARYAELLEEMLKSPRHPFDQNLRSALPVEGGVYRILEKGADWQDSLYVGKSTSLRRRVYQMHFMGGPSVSVVRKKLVRDGPCVEDGTVTQYLKDEACVQFVMMGEAERALFEHFAVAILRPRYND